jgi:UDP-glucose 4-epimerase
MMSSAIGNILVTGASGFIGGRLRQDGTRALVRKKRTDLDTIGDLLDFQSLLQSCKDIDTIFHCAGYAHAFSGSNADTHWRINFEGTRNLIEAAGISGVKRVIFLSSVKAASAASSQGIAEAFKKAVPNAYAQAKLAAEKAVLDGGKKYNMHVVNLRLAMVYGRGGRGNLERMIRAVRAGWFPPVPETHNKRSLVHISDVLSAVYLTATDPRASQATFIIADPTPYSTRQMYDTIRGVLGLAPVRWSVSESWFRAAGYLGDRLEKFLPIKAPIDSEVVRQLLDSEYYSPHHIADSLGWRAQTDLQTGLCEMIE